MSEIRRNTGIADKQAFGTLATLPQQAKIKKTFFVPLNHHIIAQVTDMYIKVFKGLSNKTK